MINRIIAYKVSNGIKDETFPFHFITGTAWGKYIRDTRHVWGAILLFILIIMVNALD